MCGGSGVFCISLAFGAASFIIASELQIDDSASGSSSDDIFDSYTGRASFFFPVPELLVVMVF